MTDQQQETAFIAWRSIIEPQPYPAKTLRGFLGQFFPSLIEVNPYSRMALLKDISHYDDLTADDPRVNGVDGLICKLGGSENNPRTVMGNPYVDDKFNRYAQLAWDLDVPLIVYWMNGPRVYQDNGMTELNLHQCSEETHPVFSMMLQAWHAGLKWKAIKEFMFDYEEPNYWMDLPYTIDEYWTQLYCEELRGNRLVHKMATSGEETYPFPRISIGLYSRRSFLLEHDREAFSIKKWMDLHPELSTWPANYPRKIPFAATVAEVRASWLPLATWKPYTLRDDGSWTYWQFAGDPDWDLYNGTREELYTRLGYVPHGVVVPPPPPAPVVTYFATVRQAATGLKLRNAPKTGLLNAGNILDNDFRPAVKLPLLGAPVVDGAITWASFDYAGKPAYFAVKVTGEPAPYADVVSVTA